MSNYNYDKNFLELKFLFIKDCVEKITDIELRLLHIEKNNKTDVSIFIRDIFSIIHSIKGSAQSFQFEIISTLCHIFEDKLTLLMNLDQIDESHLEYLFKIIDILREYIQLYNEQKEQINNHAFKNKYNTVLFLKSKKNNENLQNNVNLRILIVGFPNSLIKQINRACSSFKTISLSIATTIEDALHRINNESIDIVISSYKMEPINGLSLCGVIKMQHQAKAPFFILNPSDSINESLLVQNLQPDSIILRNESFIYNFMEFITKIQNNKKITISKNSKILFIDDNELIIELYKDIVDINNNINGIYNNGYISIEDIEKIQPNLILCDICLPSINTIELFEKIKKSNRISTVPVVFITGDQHSNEAKELLSLGANGILDKSQINVNFFETLKDFKIIID